MNPFGKAQARNFGSMALVSWFCFAALSNGAAELRRSAIEAELISGECSDGISAQYVLGDPLAGGSGYVRVRGIPNRLPDGEQAIALYTKRPERGRGTPIFGSSAKMAGGLQFHPKFPLQSGIDYYIALRLPSNTIAEDEGADCLFAFSIPADQSDPDAEVSSVYPSGDQLPENLLKFYIHFSEPMSGGNAYQHIQLLNSVGDPVELPFLELGEELWDRDHRRLTLLFDPGRIKSGLKPRREVGMALEAGNRYTLVVAKEFPDGSGRTLKNAFRKSFSVVEADGRSPDIRAWGISDPDPGSRDPLVLDFDEALDEALLRRVLRVFDAAGNPVSGALEISEFETRWTLTPDDPWKRGLYELRAETILEDLAGNSLGRTFEIDMTKEGGVRPEHVAIREFLVD